MWRFVQFLNRWLYCFYKSGTIVIHGSGEYRIFTRFTPDQVWAEFDDPNGAKGVCNAEPDGFDIDVIPRGFVITARLNSDKRKIRWIAIK
jgi:hypothetical protein